jgi:hypothetical protein
VSVYACMYVLVSVSLSVPVPVPVSVFVSASVSVSLFSMSVLHSAHTREMHRAHMDQAS